MWLSWMVLFDDCPVARIPAITLFSARFVTSVLLKVPSSRWMPSQLNAVTLLLLT